MPKRSDDRYRHLTGVTLFHAARSNCSARVRLLLCEKAIAWNSRLVSLRDQENRTAEYFAINPKGLVPALIHNGWVITESNEILEYLEETFPIPGFRPGGAAEGAAMSSWMTVSAELHLPGVKTLNYSQRAARSGTGARDDMDRYRMLQSDPELVRFHEKASGRGFSAEERASAAGLLMAVLSRMDEELATQPWLAGARYSLADICWAPTIPTIIRAGLDLTPFSHVREWHQRIADREAYSESVTKWDDRS